MTRASDLPDFKNPPLNEVVIGVQFAPAQGYSQIRAGAVWDLFKSDFPLVEEHPPLAPTFEMFGRPQAQQINFDFVTGASHDRFWFLAPGKEELIQFQHDRLLHNWRKVTDGVNEYPRYERMIEKFENELKALEIFFSGLAPQKLAINQCEVTYINHIPYGEQGNCPADQWLRFLQFGDDKPESVNVGFRRVLNDIDGLPVGRLVCEAVSALADNKTVLRLALTARGRPSLPEVPAALEFLHRGREMVVKTFAEVTTKFAHDQWQRVQ